MKVSWGKGAERTERERADQEGVGRRAAALFEGRATVDANAIGLRQ